MPEYTDEERERAAEALDSYATDMAGRPPDSYDFGDFPEEYFDDGECDHNGDHYVNPIVRLADDALMSVPMFYGDDVDSEIPFHEQAAEAASWIREGWSEPGPERGW